MAPPEFFPETVSTNDEKASNPGFSRFSLSSNREIRVDGVTLLSSVPENVTLSDFSSVEHSADSTILSHILKSVDSKAENGSFLGLSVDKPLDRILSPIGKFSNRKFLSIFRFKTWWSTMWTGSSGSDLQMETQLILLQVPELNSYVLVVPILEGSFRSAFHPGDDGEVIFCIESGSSRVRGTSFSSCCYFHLGNSPFDLIKDAFRAIRVHLGTFRLLEEKAPPRIVDKFGWCTWDAFYLTVEPVGVWHGLCSFADNGLPPRFLIIDDGWQSINMDHDNPLEDSKDLTCLGSQMLCRLYQFQENCKFAKYQEGTMLRPDAPSFDQEKHDQLFVEMMELGMKKRAMKEANEDDPNVPEPTIIEYLKEEKGGSRGGLKALIKDLKKKFESLDDVYLWHALLGAWGGVRPGGTHLNSKITAVKPADNLEKTMEDLAVFMIEKAGIGLVDPNQAANFYEAMHSYLADAGVTGVKVDVIHTLEYVCEDHGGRVQLAKTYYDGLSKSLRKNFNGRGLIASMEQCNDFFLLATKDISMGRVGDDFWLGSPTDPMSVYWLQGVHMVHCSYNSLWQGQFIHPDWDMFQSDHLCAEFHAGSRAICGGPIYVSDKVGNHNFDLLRKLVLPDGTILKCQHYALPTKDCLFENPLFDGKTLLKIWNLNKFGGVIGVFNCQGAGWYPEEQKCKGYPECYKTISGIVSPNDVEWEQKDFTAKFRENELFAIYLNKANDLLVMNSRDEISITLQPTSFEIFTISPVEVFEEKAKFAAIGLENMLNSGGAIESLDYDCNRNSYSAVITIKGAGKFLAYSSIKPKEINLNGEIIDFEWFSNGFLKFEVPWMGGESSSALVQLN